MITSLTVKNFRTLHDVTWKPGRLSVLTGANNSGKTNLAYALRFLSATARLDSLDDAGNEACGTASEVVCRHHSGQVVEFGLRVAEPAHGVEFQYDLALAPRPIMARDDPFCEDDLGVQSEKLWWRGANGDSKDARWHPLIHDDGQAVKLYSEDGSEREASERPQARRGTTLAQEKSLAYYTHVFRSYISRFRYYHIAAEHLRADARLMELAALSGTGDNFAAVLYGMKNEDEGSYRRLLSLVQEVDPSVEYFNCIHLRDGRIVVEVKHKGVAETGPLAALSDGTLLYMALCMVALQPTLRTRRTVTPPSLVLFEEPENGLYVRRLHQLFDRLKEMSERTQTIITTHSPFLLDFFDDAVEDIFVLRNGENGTEIKQANPAKVDQLLETMSMGEMLYRELLTCE